MKNSLKTKSDLIKEVMKVAKEKGIKELTFSKDDTFNTTIHNPRLPGILSSYISKIVFDGEIAKADCIIPCVDNKVHKWEIDIFSINRLKSLLEILKTK